MCFDEKAVDSSLMSNMPIDFLGDGNGEKFGMQSPLSVFLLESGSKLKEKVGPMKFFCDAEENERANERPRSAAKICSRKGC